MYAVRCDFRHAGRRGTLRLLYTGTGHDFIVGPSLCPGVSVCYAVIVTGLDRPRNEFILSTKNGWQTWSKHKLPAGEALACPSIEVCYIASRLGPTIFRT